ncbi:response regulator [Isoptericola aurantiacus]|uniref:response regulator n=1 Tax=Isoptericola aurantiacus TaxID=3377839 RepID=UPI00383B9409
MSEDADLRVVVVDDHEIFREGLAALLDRAAGTVVVGTAGSGEDAVGLVTRVRPDVVLMDIRMPGTSGIDATQRITAAHADVAVVMLTMVEDDDALFAAMRAGAGGYVLKGADSEEVLRAVHAAGRGDLLLGSQVARRLGGMFRAAPGSVPTVTPFPGLTGREREVLDLVASGLSNAVIARRLDVSVKTVANHVSNVLVKLQVPDRPQAIVAARRAGLGGDDGQAAADRPG